MDKFFEIGTRLGLEGEDLRTFISEQQNIDRENRIREREDREREREERELERVERQKEREHELEIKKLEVMIHESNTNNNATETTFTRDNGPKLPAFIDYKDDLDSYLNRFERYAKCNKWERASWSTSLSALLTGRALDVYSRLSETVAADYDRLKDALLKRYELTESGFRFRFRNSKPEHGESPEQFITRLQNYLHRWIDLSNTNHDFSSVCDLFIQEQFISSCSPELAVFLKERSPSGLEEIAKLADQYLIAHGRSLASNDHIDKTQSNNFKGDSKRNYKSQQFSRSFDQYPTSSFYSSNDANGNQFKPRCTFCNLSHKAEKCERLTEMNAEKRRDAVKISGLAIYAYDEGIFQNTAILV